MRNSQNRYFYHIFVSPADAPLAITLNVVWMEREFDAYKLSRGMYPSIFNSFPVIRTASAKHCHFHVPPPTFLFPLGTPLGQSRYVVWMERERDAYKLSRCMCQSIYYHFWDTARYLWKKSSFYHTPLHSTPPLGGFPSEYRHLLWYGKTIMVSLADNEKISKICLFILTWSTNVTDGQTDRQTLHDSINRACIASRGKNLLFRGQEQLSTSLPYERSSQAEVNASKEVIIRQKTRRSFWSFSAFDESVVNRRTVTEGDQVRATYGGVSTQEDTVISSTVSSQCSHVHQHMHSTPACSLRCRNFSLLWTPAQRKRASML